MERALHLRSMAVLQEEACELHGRCDGPDTVAKVIRPLMLCLIAMLTLAPKVLRHPKRHPTKGKVEGARLIV